jgi:secondary thiamine-phosphate synthase enzyme
MAITVAPWSPVVTLVLLLWLFQPPTCAFLHTTIATKNAHLVFRLCSSHPTARHPDSNNIDRARQTMPTPLWFQHAITVTAPSRGCHLITGEILKAAGNDLRSIEMGMCNLFIQHTSASLTINENADPDVRTDMETALNKLVPALWNRDGTFRHTMEGDDDMPGHVKSSLMGVSLNIPIRNGKLALGTWQGVYLNEHRDQGGWGGGHKRSIIVTLQGVGK